MINMSTITRALESQLAAYLAGVAVAPRAYTVKRSAYINQDPDITPWVCVYRGKLDLEPRTLGRVSNFTALPDVKLAVQASSTLSGDQAEDRLETNIVDVMDGVFSDYTIGGTIEMISRVSIEYTYEANESESMFFHMAEITISLQAKNT